MADVTQSSESEAPMPAGQSSADLVRDFRRRLRRLRTDVGEPSAKELLAALTATRLRMAAPTLSEFASDKRPHVLPQRDFVEAYVTACLRYRGDSPAQAGPQVHGWLSSWTAIAVAIGTTLRVTTPQDPTPERTDATPAIAPTQSDPSDPTGSAGTPGSAGTSGSASTSGSAGLGGSVGSGGLGGPPGRSGGRRRLRRRWWVPVAVVAEVALLALVATVSVTQWPKVATADDPGTMTVPLGSPDRTHLDDSGCASRDATLRNGLAAPMGTARLEDCPRTLRLTWTDHLADGYCVYVVVTWPDGSTDRADNACPAGEIEQTTLPKRAPEYSVTLGAVNVDKTSPK